MAAPSGTQYIGLTPPTVSSEEAAEDSPLFDALADAAYSHSLLHTRFEVFDQQDQNITLFAEHVAPSMFEGICMDNGAEKSVAGLPAYKRYCAHTHSTLDLQPSSESFRVGDVVHSSLGKANIRMPVDKEGNFIRGTHFSAATFVKSESAIAVRNSFVTCWVAVYVGFPNVLTHDQGKYFTSDCVTFGLIPKARQLSPTTR